MTNNYIELITEALFQKNWDIIIKYATQAKHEENGDMFLGVRKGYINVFYGDTGRILPLLEEAGIKVFDCFNQPELNKEIKSGRLSLEIVKTECVILFTKKATVVSRLVNLNYPINYFTINTKSVGVKSSLKIQPNGRKEYGKYDLICTLSNKATGETMKFKADNNIFKAILRNNRIDTILN